MKIKKCIYIYIFIFIYSLTQLVVSALANLKLKIFCVDARNKVLVAMMYIRKIENTGKIALNIDHIIKTNSRRLPFSPEPS